MAKIPFNVSAYTARLIGRENVATLNGAILELVKNTYDADATLCVLYYDDIDSCVYLIDNGCGMTENIIIKHWMTIGNSSKKRKFISGKGRIQTGAKGIGRFALDRIADCCEMLTINEEESLLWKVDWRTFKDENNITEITADLDKTDITPKVFLDKIHNNAVKETINSLNFKTGTIFKLTELRERWTDNRVSKIMDNLRSLIPVSISREFQIYVFANSFDKEKAEVLTDNNDFNYDYKVNFFVQKDRLFIKMIRNEFELNNQLDNINSILLAKKETPFGDVDKNYFLGEPISYEIDIREVLSGFLDAFTDNFDGEFYFSKLTTNKKDSERYFYKYSSPKKINEIFSGIKIYRDNFRVRPYGEYDSSLYDWLLLDRRKAQSPAAVASKGIWRLRADQIFGSINISRNNPNLMDQSNREGIVETKEFIALKKVVVYVIERLEMDRQYVFRKLRDYNEIIEETDKIEKEIEERAIKQIEANEKKKQRGNIESNNNGTITESKKNEEISVIDAKKVIDKKNEEIKELIEENNLLMTLATTGIVTNTYVHELKSVINLVSVNNTNALRAFDIKDYEACSKFIQNSYNRLQSLNSWFEITINSVKSRKRQKKEIIVNELIGKLLQSWQDLLSPKKISILLSNDDDITLRCFPYEIETILNNLITNSITSFDSIDKENKLITVNLREENGLIIEYNDNGIGLSAKYKNKPDIILNQFETDKVDENGEYIGTGLGMAIIKAIVTSYNGYIDLSENKELDEGFKVIIYLKGVE